MEFITRVKKALLTCIQEEVRGKTVERATSLSAMEVEVKGMLHEVGNALMSAWLETQDAKYPADTQACACGEQARYVRRRSGVSLTLLGRVRYRRAYSVCPHCHQGQYPLDQCLGIRPGQMSDEVVKVAALVGGEDAYGSSRELLLQTAQLDLSPNSIRRACLQVGQAVEDWEAQALNESQDSAQLLRQRRQAVAPDRLYASMAGYLVRFDDSWHEMKAGAFGSVSGKGQAEAIEYDTDTASAEAFSDMVWARAVARRAHLAHELVFIADGARWIWRIVQRHFPHAIQIVDWFHASRYLVKIAHAAFGESSPQASTWLETAKTALYDGRLGAVIRACRALAPLAPQAVADARSYFAANRTRLRYAKFRALGLQIGSGSMESGCKQIALERLKIAGAQWSPDGAHKLAKARAAFLSHQVNLSFAPLPQAA